MKSELHSENFDARSLIADALEGTATFIREHGIPPEPTEHEEEVLQAWGDWVLKRMGSAPRSSIALLIATLAVGCTEHLGGPSEPFH